MTAPDIENLVTTAADLGRRDAERKPEPYELDDESSIVVARVRNDESVQVHDLEVHLFEPRQPRGRAIVHDPGDFAGYAIRLADEDTTTVWADLNAGTVTAVLDDHAHSDRAGWRRHTVTLDLQPDPDWQEWEAADKKLMGQAEFAEFLEQRLHTIASPPAADLYEVAVSLQATRSASFRSGVRLANGDTQVAYDEETTAKAGSKGNLEIPDSFTVRLAPFAYTDPVEVVAKLRYRIEQGRLKIGFVLIQPHVKRRDAFASIVGRLRDELKLSDGTALPVYLGAPPAATAPLR
ncbi:DUF2303 family protein [Amycolatopsis sp. CA-161197]|uniref:DUF2303 family protein n=1 Tax=Amycolatopsis sp. CA-161197 TaxID=3239922 RepID=UPI003D91F607